MELLRVSEEGFTGLSTAESISQNGAPRSDGSLSEGNSVQIYRRSPRSTGLLQ
jgi:hypothetical protein